MPRYKLVNNVKIQFTAAEETLKDNQEAQAAIEEKSKIDAEANAIAKKASGKQKLLDLGLSEEEVKALIGV